MDKRGRLVEIFHDTQAYYRENEKLAAAVEASRMATVLYSADHYPELPQLEDDAPAGKVVISKGKTFETAMRLLDELPGRKVAVLNFASATNPGGGVKSGSSAQEECLCRCSTLYPTLDRRWLWQQFYDVNRALADNRHTDDCIYSPGIVICKSDTAFPERLSEHEWRIVDVITCAAPNLRNEPANWYNPDTGAPLRMDPDELYRLHLQRARHILHIAAANGVNALVLGAFGCGAFANDPSIVAQAYRDVLPEYLSRFDRIEFAIYCRDFETENYSAFKAVLG